MVQLNLRLTDLEYGVKRSRFRYLSLSVIDADRLVIIVWDTWVIRACSYYNTGAAAMEPLGFAPPVHHDK